MKYLETFAEEDASTLNEAKEEAVRAIIEFVKSPDMFQVELDHWNTETHVLFLSSYRIPLSRTRLQCCASKAHMLTDCVTAETSIW